MRPRKRKRITSVDTTATYTYGPDGERARKDLSGGAFTEYVYLGGQAMAEKSSAGDWTDYIFANGQRVAKAEALSDVLHTFGTKNGASQWVVEYFNSAAGLLNYTIRSGDKLFLNQYQNTGSDGGMVLNFADHTTSSWSVKDKEGYYLNDDHSQAVNHFRTIDLSSLAGKVISKVGLDQEIDTVNGTWGIMYSQVSLVSTDGTVYPIYTGQTSSPITSNTQSGGETGIGSQIDVNRGLATSPTLTTTYYVADHLGSSRLLMSGNGNPIWSGVFLPYGQEWNPQITMNTYKFTGDERDGESNLDHTWFRQYEATQGRWLSPDPARMAAADGTNPQSLNRYTYVLNNPMRFLDPLGLDCMVFNDDGTTDIYFDYELGDDPEGNCDDAGGTYSYPGGVTVDGGPPDPVPDDPVQAPNDPILPIASLPTNFGTFSGPADNADGSAQCPIAYSAAAKAASTLGKTVLLGVGGSAGVAAAPSPLNLRTSPFKMTPGSIKASGPFGVAGEVSVSFAVDPSGNAAYAITYGGNPGFLVFGAGAIGGAQVGVSSVKNVNDLVGMSTSFSFSGGSGPGGGVEVSFSNSGVSVTGTVGFATGTKGAAFTVTNTKVIPVKCK